MQIILFIRSDMLWYNTEKAIWGEFYLCICSLKPTTFEYYYDTLRSMYKWKLDFASCQQL